LFKTTRTYLGIEELLIGLKVGTESLVGVTDEVSLVHKSLLESLSDVSCNVGIVEFCLLLLVLGELVSNFLIESFLLTFYLTLNCVIDLLLLVMLTFDLSELCSQSTQLLDLRGKTVLFLFAFNINLLNQGSQFLKRLGFNIVKLLF